MVLAAWMMHARGYKPCSLAGALLQECSVAFLRALVWVPHALTLQRQQRGGGYAFRLAPNQPARTLCALHSSTHFTCVWCARFLPAGGVAVRRFQFGASGAGMAWLAGEWMRHMQQFWPQGCLRQTWRGSWRLLRSMCQFWWRVMLYLLLCLEAWRLAGVEVLRGHHLLGWLVLCAGAAASAGGGLNVWRRVQGGRRGCLGWRVFKWRAGSCQDCCARIAAQHKLAAVHCTSGMRPMKLAED